MPGMAMMDVIMLIDPQLPRRLWPIRKVACFISSEDGCVRTVEVNIGGKLYVKTPYMTSTPPSYGVSWHIPDC